MQRSRGIWARLLGYREERPSAPDTPQITTHVILLDGTMSSLRAGSETNIGRIYRLLMTLPVSACVNIHYEPGIQWRGIRHSHEVIAGIGINRMIRRAYLFLAKRYRPGDRIIFLGYSRGAYAVRSLAGLIDKLGLLRASHADSDTVEEIYTLYREAPDSDEAKHMKDALAHDDLRIDLLGVFDTVRALGIRWPIVWRLMPMPHPFHSHHLGPTTRLARQALALDETRESYAPVLWQTTPEQAQSGTVEQVWFRGSHGDVGGQIDGEERSRPLANLSLVWMLEQMEAIGVPLPDEWRTLYPTDANAPSIGTYRGWGKLFLLRRRRVVGRDPSEKVHPSAARLPAARALAGRETRHQDDAVPPGQAPA